MDKPEDLLAEQAAIIHAWSNYESGPTPDLLELYPYFESLNIEGDWVAVAQAGEEAAGELFADEHGVVEACQEDLNALISAVAAESWHCAIREISKLMGLEAKHMESVLTNMVNDGYYSRPIVRPSSFDEFMHFYREEEANG